MNLPLLRNGGLTAVVPAWFGTEVGTRVYFHGGLGLPFGIVREDRYSFLVIIGAFFATSYAAVSTRRSGVWPAPVWVYYVGMGALVVGVAVRGWPLLALGRFFSPVVRTSEEQRLVRTGRYRWVPHPSQTGLWLALVGLTLALSSPLGILFALGACGLALGYRIQVEEAALLRRFGDEYRACRARTWRLSPFVV